MSEIAMTDANVLAALLASSREMALGGNTGSPDQLQSEKSETDTQLTEVVTGEPDAHRGQQVLAQLGAGGESVEQAFAEHMANAGSHEQVEAAPTTQVYAAWREDSDSSDGEGEWSRDLEVDSHEHFSPSAIERDLQSDRSSASASQEDAQNAASSSRLDEGVLPARLGGTGGKLDRGDEHVSPAGMDKRDEHHSARRKPFSSGSGAGSGAGGDASFDTDLAADVAMEAEMDEVLSGNDRVDHELQNAVRMEGRVGADAEMDANLHERIQEDEDEDDERRRKRSESEEEEHQELAPSSEPFAESLLKSSPGPKDIVSHELSHRDVLSLLSKGEQQDALREIRLRRRVLVLVPAAGDKAAEKKVVEAYLVGVDSQSRGWVCQFGSCHWYDETFADLPPLWRSWRVHRDTDSEGTTWLRSAAIPQGGEARRTLAVRLGPSVGPLQNRYGAALEIRDAHRFVQVMGLQWSLMVAMSPPTSPAVPGQP